MLSVGFEEAPWCIARHQYLTIEDTRLSQEEKDLGRAGNLKFQWSCSIHGERDCPGALALVEQLLHDLSHAQPGDPLEQHAAKIASPLWRDTLVALTNLPLGTDYDEKASARPESVKPLPQGILRWKLMVDKDGRPLSIGMVIQIPNKKKGFKTTNVPMARYLALAQERGTPEDMGLAELAHTQSLLGHHSYWHSEVLWQGFWRLLLALAALLVGDAQQLYALKRMRSRIIITPCDHDEISVTPASDTGQLAWIDVPAMPVSTGPILLREASSQSYQLLDLPSETRPILRQLRRCDGRFPHATLDQVLKSLGGHPELPVDVHRDIAGQEIRHFVQMASGVASHWRSGHRHRAATAAQGHGRTSLAVRLAATWTGLGAAVDADGGAARLRVPRFSRRA